MRAWDSGRQELRVNRACSRLSSKSSRRIQAKRVHCNSKASQKLAKSISLERQIGSKHVQIISTGVCNAARTTCRCASQNVRVVLACCSLLAGRMVQIPRALSSALGWESACHVPCHLDTWQGAGVEVNTHAWVFVHLHLIA